MICQTIRVGSDCAFMTATGCGYNNGVCHEIIEECQGCNRTVQLSSGIFCSACPEPKAKWKGGRCNMATHIAAVVETAKAKINPIKASKRGNR